MNELYMSQDDAEAERMMAIREIEAEGLLLTNQEQADRKEEYAS